MPSTAQTAILLKGGKILTHSAGGLPAESLALEHFVFVRSFRSVGYVVIESFTGKIPDGWSWSKMVDVQSQMSDRQSALLGRALLCADGGGGIKADTARGDVEESS